MRLLASAWQDLAVRADLTRSTGVRHAWRRRQRDRAFARTAATRRQRLGKDIWREAAEAIGATMTDLSPIFAEIRLGDSATLVAGETAALNDVVATELAGEKALVHGRLAAAGLPVPEQLLLVDDGVGAAAEAFLRARGVCVVKPSRGSGGDGITGEIRRPDQLRRALREAWRYRADVLVERQVPGEVYRVLVLDGEVLAAIRRHRPCIHGDGTSTIEELMFAEYDTRVAADGDGPIKPFAVDLDCLFTLEASGLRLDSVPGRAAVVVVKTVSNYNRVVDNTAIPVGELARIEHEVIAAARTVGLRLSGVDVVAPTLDRPLSESGGVILELNARPALHHHRDVEDPATSTQIAARILRASLE
jgi:cyanophycin synthetase